MSIPLNYDDRLYVSREIRSQRLALVGVIDILSALDTHTLHGDIELEQIIAQITNALSQLASLNDRLSQKPGSGGGL